ncbi:MULTISPECIES: diguanylate cyclase [unclassified Sphingomonas]|uniref:ligand-binding sensor domain-containing protein n=1 Tax=unclassified Sphingomonas TaxID=196159 RepID=UPI00070123D1|nr:MULTISPECIES: ligand-binding sensor domain-containing diguanylate cyclase [unclassified Sphingomonas]KQN05067.1 hypothetical protein ASE78_17000 [Sphingomonas sp. Leaf25]KQN36695.1 hypothetical protein ASE97_13315 [Sphingomonas sp. Leaf42]KQT27317.1 hypothetical protein ASG37_14060 [Sphingomonas sp. Leaf407]
MRRFAWMICIVASIAPALAGNAASIDDWARWRAPRFATLGGGGGLPHATATAIVQSSEGLMWIGTRGGLARYDGQRIRTFRQRSGDATSLPDNYIRALLPLAHGSMLVGTNVGGIVRFDPVAGGFVRLRGAEGTRIGARILAFTPDGQGGALIASDHGVFRYDARSDRVVPLLGAGPAARDLAGGAFAVHRDADGTIMAGADKGLFVRRPGSDRFVPLALPDIGDVWAIARDTRGRLWIGTGSHGIVVRQADGRFVRPPALAGSSALIGHRTIRSFAPGPDGAMWVGTDGMGVLRIDPDRGYAVRALRNIPADAASLGGDTVRAVTLDRTGRLWAATDVGVSQTDPARDAILSLTNAMPDPAQSLADTNVRGVMVDRADRIWVGMSNGLIDRIDRAGGAIRHLKLSGGHAGQDIKAFAEAADGGILAGGRGVVAIDPRTLRERPLAVPDLGNLPVISLARMGDRLLIGTYKGLFDWNMATNAVRRYRHVDGDDTSLANNEVINIVAAGDGGAWIATPAGVSRYDPATGRFTTYRNRSDDPASLPQNYTGSIVAAGPVLWVGTYGGVARGTRHGGDWRFRAITEGDGLANDNVASLLADRRGRIWAASATGISVVPPGGTGVRIVSRRDGLTPDSFNQRAAAVTQGGDLLFGGTGGLLVVRPDAMLGARRTAPPSLVTTEVEQDGRALPVDPFPGRHPIRIAGGRHSVRIAFALTDYAAPQEVRYRYRLEGFDDAWVAVPEGTPASATYTNLPGGNYVLHLSAYIPGVDPRFVTTSVDLSVAPSWYEHWWVRLIGLMVVVLAILGVVQTRTLVLRRRTRTLEALIDQRTQELRAANVSLAHLAATDPLTGLANRRTLMARLEEERERAARTGHGFALAMIDIDHFKRVNDTHGHQTGDRVIRAIAERIGQAVRTVDCVARYGGEEIAILLPATTLGEAGVLTDRIRRSIGTVPVEIDGIAIPITISGGVAASDGTETIGILLHRADQALYRAKRDGRDRIEAAPASLSIVA